MDELFKQREQRVATKIEQPSVDPGLKLDASEALREVRGDLNDVITQDDREAFVLRHLQREAERFEADDETLAALDADEPRTRPLCTCRDSGCALKEGRLPVVVREASSLQEGIRRFRHEHTGDPVVLDDADSKLDDKKARVMQTYDHIMISLSNKIPIDEVRRMQSEDGPAADADDAETAESEG